MSQIQLFARARAEEQDSRAVQIASAVRAGGAKPEYFEKFVDALTPD